MKIFLEKNGEPYYDMAEAATMTGIHFEALYKASKSGEFETEKIRATFATQTEIMRFREAYKEKKKSASQAIKNNRANIKRGEFSK